MKDMRLALGAVGLLGCIAVAVAKEEGKNPHWLSQEEIADLIAQEPPPPAPGSDAEKTDLQEELDAQNTRTPERIAEAKLDANYSVELFTAIIGPKITEQDDPVAFRFFKEANKQIAEVVTESKKHWKRPRPYLTHPEIHPLFTAGDYSYPSGHSTHSFAFAEILAAMFPEHAAAFLDRAHGIARSRVDAGVHYTSDIEEGEVLGKEVAKELMAKPAFQEAMRAAQAEVAGHQ